MSIFSQLKLNLTSNLQSHNIAYILYPFLRIFKLSGFAPIQLKNGDILRYRRGAIEPLKWDFLAWAWTAFGVGVYIIGFIFGICHVYEEHNWKKLREEAVIAFYTSWVQILLLFFMGNIAVIASWAHITDTQRLFALIFRIDEGLKAVACRIDYKALRRRLFIEFSIVFIIPTSLSMVNCIILTEFNFTYIATCFWFICFTPIMLITFTGFQFYNLLYILNMKFESINVKLKALIENLYDTGVQRKPDRMRRLTRMHARTSTSEMPLTSMGSIETMDNGVYQSSPPPQPLQPAPLQSPQKTNAFCSCNSAACLTSPMHANARTLAPQPAPATTPSAPSPPDVLQQLLHVFSLTADAVELLLQIFGWHLVLTTASAIVVIIIQSYNIFAYMIGSLPIKNHQITIIAGWIFVQIAVISVNVSICNTTAKTMSKTGPLLHKIRPAASAAITVENSCLFYQLLQLFSMEVLQRKDIFNAAGFFDINFKLITSIIAAITTYLVIIIQFHLTNAGPSNTTTS